MSCSKTDNRQINDLFRDCVRADMKHGPRNESGAIATVAANLGVSPYLVKLRCRNRVTGTSRDKNIRERCWLFLDRIAERERAWAEALAESIKHQRDELQTRLPLEGGNNGPSGHRSVARGLESAEGYVADARTSLDVYQGIRPKSKR